MLEVREVIDPEIDNLRTRRQAYLEQGNMPREAWDRIETVWMQLEPLLETMRRGGPSESVQRAVFAAKPLIERLRKEYDAADEEIADSLSDEG